LRLARGPGRPEREHHLQLLQAARLQHNRDGRVVPQHRRDQGAGRLRLPHHFAAASGRAARRGCRSAPQAVARGRCRRCRHGQDLVRRGRLPLGPERGPDGHREAQRRHPQVQCRRRQAAQDPAREAVRL
ncbi:hypothetical protein LPJ75_003976, partial [Coemansia sp. RSA 2598]